MGITIGYRGRLRPTASAADLAREATLLGAARGWRVDPLVDDDPDRGPLRGVTLWPHDDCDPLAVGVDADGVVDDFCKTAFAPAEVHVAVCDVLRGLERVVVWEEVFDEGGYWEGGDASVLAHERAVFEAMLDQVAARPGVRVGVKLPDGRHLDVLSDDDAEPGDDPMNGVGWDPATATLDYGAFRLAVAGGHVVPGAPGEPIGVYTPDETTVLQLSWLGRDPDDDPIVHATSMCARVCGDDVAQEVASLPGARGFTAFKPDVPGRMKVWCLAVGEVTVLATATSGAATPGAAAAAEAIVEGWLATLAPTA